MQKREGQLSKNVMEKKGSLCGGKKRWKGQGDVRG